VLQSGALTPPTASSARRRPTPAVYRRRRLALLAGVAVALLLALLLIRSCGAEAERPALTAEQARQAELEANPVELTLSFSGDLLIHTAVFARAQALDGGDGYDFAPLFEEIRPYVEDADLAFCHVETPMTSAPPASYPIFNTPPEMAEGIAATGWDACDTASNHTLDQGEEGVGETQEALDRAGVEYTGSATSERQQRRPLILEADGIRVAYLAYTSDTNGIPVPRPYTVNLIDPEQIAEDARAASKAGADVVIVNLHWASEAAPEYVTEPSAEQEEVVRQLVKVPEITALVGQGPHVVQPISKVRGKYVVFSEGNLISNQGADTGLAAESQDGYIALLDLVVDGSGARVTGARYVPTWTDHADYRVLPVGDALEAGEADPASLRASYERTVDVVADHAATPVPANLP
jgi:poly-gamma-glutamate capsule biosynthesis protein CapA/YwtB (metallophosphatase superfamily)